MTEKKSPSILESIAQLSSMGLERHEKIRKSIFGLSKIDESFEPALNYLAFSSEQYKTNSVSFLKAQSGIDYYDLVRMFKYLDKQEVGSFVVGRKGKESRFTWKYHPRSVGQLGLGKNIPLETLPNGILDYDGGFEVAKEGLRHVFNLRKDFPVEINLPSDFSSNDLERLKNWLSLLVY